MKEKIIWFRHNHENRNDLLRYGLMKLHYAGEIEYIEKNFSDARGYGFSSQILKFPDLRHKSFLLLKKSNKSITCMVDNEDSFALLSPLLKEVDLYFCAGYNTDIFEHKQFVKAYNWQDETDLIWYKQSIEEKINQLGPHFYKIKKFIPIAPNLAFPIELSWIRSRIRNLEYKIGRLTGKGNNFKDDFNGFELRYQYLLSLRDNSLSYDITLNDTLWGWPQHRINLHEQLSSLNSKGYKIHSILKYAEPVEHDGSIVKKINVAHLPITTRPLIENYEKMLSKSKAAVFACGFHWGWRNIMTLALMMGIPVVTDRLLVESYFDINKFEMEQVEDHSWKSVERFLSNLTGEKWSEIKLHNQFVYDKYLSPEIVAQYFLKTIIS